MKKPHYAWVICFACLLLYICNMGLCSNILTIYLPFIEQSGISHSQGSAILSVRCLFSFFTTFFVSLIYEKLPLRTGLFAASLVGCACPIIFCVGGGAFAYYLGAALAGVAYGAGSVYPASILISRWFHTRRGLAVGISSAGSGVSTMLFSPLLSSVVLKYSLKTAFLLQSGIMLVGAISVYLLVRNKPEELGIEAYNDGKMQDTDIARGNEKPLSSALLSLLAIMMLLNGGAGLAFSGHLSVLTVSCGYSAELSARMVSAFGLILIISKLIAGNIADRIGSRKCSVLLIGTFIVGCSFVFGMDGANTVWCFALVGFLGFGASVFNVGPPLWASALSPSQQYGKTLKWLQLFYNLGGIVFTVLPGFIADRTGEYKSSYVMFAAMMLVSLMILSFAYKRQNSLKKR